MGKQEFDLVMSKVDDIAVAVNKFPESAQGVACKEIISALIGDSSLSSNGSESRENSTHDHIPVNVDNAVDDAKVTESLEWYADSFDLVSINNLQFAAFVAFFYCELASEVERVDAIDKGHLEIASDIVGRDLPGNLTTTLSDAKTKKRYLASKGKGRYEVAHAGKRYVKNELLKREQE